MPWQQFQAAHYHAIVGFRVWDSGMNSSRYWSRWRGITTLVGKGWAGVISSDVQSSVMLFLGDSILSYIPSRSWIMINLVISSSLLQERGAMRIVMAGVVVAGNFIIFVVGASLTLTGIPQSAKGWGQCTIFSSFFRLCFFFHLLSLGTRGALLFSYWLHGIKKRSLVKIV